MERREPGRGVLTQAGAEGIRLIDTRHEQAAAFAAGTAGRVP
jgi:thiamine pyrophosphate-dependent acetolactate synthase large subunit-like protein